MTRSMMQTLRKQVEHPEQSANQENKTKMSKITRFVPELKSLR